ncbi:DUF2752 domain-containing protein [Flavobacterium sp.]|uniref:DUF2752 domain-containing protein n=1 Tax=Flavobacterium sp. TaxID=239 RepID=UPI0011FEEAE5|nr:DUF2752 domain-containing protein [Flavobacterium sp.]RZJ72242.1 MAG: DUF2752 domain-containing protein [Flavobacterium sp.]
MEDYMIPCLNKRIFGFDCPGCGTQRSLNFLIHGDFVAAFHMFPAIYTTILMFVFVALHFIDKSRSYHKLIIYSAILNTSIVLGVYFYKIATII